MWWEDWQKSKNEKLSENFSCLNKLQPPSFSILEERGKEKEGDPAVSTYVSNAINSFVINFGDVIIGSIDANIDGCMLTTHVSQPNVIKIVIFNGTGGAINIGTVNVRVLIEQ
ncbi:MAG: hypothetical protein ABIJ97_08210 [Bacteroidota bacterium]